VSSFLWIHSTSSVLVLGGGSKWGKYDF